MSFITPPPPNASRDLSTRYIVAHVSLKMAQAAALVVPPTYLVFAAVRRRPISIARWMRASTLGVAGAAVVGVPMGYARLRGETQEALDDRVFRLSHNPSQIRTDDYSVMGAALGGLLIPAVFLKRANLPGLVLGGASVGLGAGVWVHLAKMFTEGSDVRPEGMVGELPVVGGNNK